MAVAPSTSRWTYNGDGTTKTPFTYDSKIFADDELLVYVDSVLQTLTTHYTVTGAGNKDGGYVSFVTAPPVGTENVVMVRSVVARQPTQYPEGGSFPSSAHEAGLDRAIIVIQQLQEEVRRALTAGVASTLTNLVMPEPGAGEILKYNAAGTALETAAIATLVANVDTVLTGLAANDGLFYDGTDWVNLTPAEILALVSPITTRGDLIAGGAEGVDQRLALGSSGQVLTSDGTDVTWGDANLPAGYMSGLGLANNGTDAAHDINVAAGVCRDAAGAADISLSALVKQIDATWAAGTNQGGLASSLTAPANDTWYHVFAIVVGGVADVGFDTSITAANLVADHAATAYRRIGSVLTDGSANIIGFLQIGDTFLWQAWVNDYTSATPGASEITTALTVPPGVSVEARLAIAAVDGTGGSNAVVTMRVYHPDAAAATPAAGNSQIVGENTSNLDTKGGSAEVGVMTDTAGQVQWQITYTNLSVASITTIGWRDPRGRN